MKIGINTLWLKHKKVGGIEAYLFNLLDGLVKVDKVNIYYIIVSNENKKLFEKYNINKNTVLIYCDVKSENIIKRLIWENINVDRIAKRNDLDIMFNPVYSKPLIAMSKIPYITTIHDLQALHYPEYFSKLKVKWLKFCWRNTVKTSDKIVAISEFVRKDIIKNYDVGLEKVCTIYNPIKIESIIDDFKTMKSKLQIEDNGYLYTVSSMFEHKNLKVLLEMMKKIKDENIDIPKKLVISGISGNFNDEFDNYVKKLGIESMVIKTGFISDNERNVLYKHCSIFLFPSIFEGFGMPPIEAMILGKKVITTKKTSIEEVTQGFAYYVDNPLDCNEWVRKVNEVLKKDEQIHQFDVYKIEKIATEYIRVFNEVNTKRLSKINECYERG